MDRFFKDIWAKFRNEDVVGKYIYVNVAVYVIIALTGVFATLFAANAKVGAFFSLFEMPSDFTRFISTPWSIITYMFMHQEIMHVLWNMLALYVFGKIFLSYYSTRHFIGVYLLGGIMGGLFFLLAYNVFPYFEESVLYSYLIGASASVLAVVMAVAIRSPQHRVNMLFFGPVKLITIALATVILSMLLVTSDNAGGNIAHLGGAFAGWLFAYMLNKGYEITKPINVVVDFFTNLPKRRFSFSRKPKIRFEKGGKRSSDYEYNAKKRAQADDIDTILDKVKHSGYSSLSEDEKRRLFDASK